MKYFNFKFGNTIKLKKISRAGLYFSNIRGNYILIVYCVTRIQISLKYTFFFSTKFPSKELSQFFISSSQKHKIRNPRISIDILSLNILLD